MARRKKKSAAWIWLPVVALAAGAGYFFYLHSAKDRSLNAGELIERCYQLQAGESLRYQYRGEDIVSFDIRRGGDGLFSPRLTPMDEDVFTAPTGDEYCLRFGNPLERAQKVQYSVQRVK